MLCCWLMRQLQCKWDSNMWYCVSTYHSSLMTSFLKDIIHSWLKFHIAYVALWIENITLHMLHCWLLRQLQCKWDSNMWYCVSRYHSSLMISFLEDIIPSWLNFQTAYVVLLVAEAVTVQMRQQYVILCFKIPFLLDDIIPWRHHSFLIKLSDCICCAVGCWGSYSANETAICDIVFQDTIPPWWHHSLKTSSLPD